MNSAGTVIFVSANGGMAVVQHSDGFAVAEMLGDEVERGDSLVADWDALGSATVTNRTKGGRIEVYMQGSWGNREAAIALARRTG